MSSMKAIRYVLLAAVSVILGRSWKLVVSYLLPGAGSEANIRESDLKYQFLTEQARKNSNNNHNALLEDQVQAQSQIQHQIYQLQNPAHCQTKTTRILASALKHPKDGFASEIQYVARLLQMAVSTRRILKFTPQWVSAYEPPDCRTSLGVSSGWECLWGSVSNCPYTTIETNSLADVTFPPDTDTLEYPFAVGIMPQKPTSTFFDTAVYGPNQVVWSPISFPRKEDPTTNIRADIIPHWERTFGRFWIRAQMAHYLWKPNAGLQNQIQARIPSELSNIMKQDKMDDRLLIGFHIRYTDNIKDFHRHFSRNATTTRSFSRFMEFAEIIRHQYPNKPIHQIYLATDNNQVVLESQQPQWERLGWTFITQKEVQRSDSQGERLWFSGGRGSAAGAIATDIEILRRADFLVGSFQSNVYRLAAELNTAWHVARYPLDIQRHWTVDVEWYEDP